MIAQDASRSSRRSIEPRSARRRALPDGAGRLVRFALVGAGAGALQLLFLFALEQTALMHLVTNAIALAAAAQVNFVCSSAFTWRDRSDARGVRGLGGRWLRFHGGIATTAVLNFAVYAVLATALPPLVAAAGGIAVAAAANFLIADRLVFRAASPARTSQPRRDVAVAASAAGGDDRPKEPSK